MQGMLVSTQSSQRTGWRPRKAKHTHDTRRYHTWLPTSFWLIAWYIGNVWMQGRKSVAAWAWEEIKKFDAGQKIGAG